MEKVKIIAGYSTCCFCNKPELPAGEPVDFYPRFEFRKAVRKYATEHGIKDLRFIKGQKAATGVLPFKCLHWEEQRIRLGWTIANY